MLPTGVGPPEARHWRCRRPKPEIGDLPACPVHNERRPTAVAGRSASTAGGRRSAAFIIIFSAGFVCVLG